MDTDGTKAVTGRLWPFFPHVFREGDDIPHDLVGAEIIRIGTDEERSGRLVIDYRPRDSVTDRQLVLGYSDRGIWVVDTPSAYSPNRDASSV